MSEYDVHTRRQLAAEHAERLARDYEWANADPEARVAAGDRRRSPARALLARLRGRSVEQAPAFRS